MDEMNFKLSTRIMKGIISKLITKILVKNLGYDADIRVNELALETKNGKVRLHVSVDAEMENSDFLEIVKKGL